MSDARYRHHHYHRQLHCPSSCSAWQTSDSPSQSGDVNFIQMSMHYQALDEEASNVEVGVGAVSPDCQVSSSLAVQPGAFAEVYQLISANVSSAKRRTTTSADLHCHCFAS
ncbi:hypothetical protein HBI56_164440 [Parastagonospora nodorum]|uniref:Uncharacterized protein n=1 Tax=Phaeosphaeria nodorum (strain SN15 / ATCC MYA-4574 / FGSC 10173) TaxID=321614 RepID=A0A7U2IB63_PHANO|nr:hypothetical protein HBH56_072220 [Parastagonospora nodorum]QRD06604.1 hypothetical protein JI435_446130 [Parastagonospora nodorum SN15]KAH3927215.1 hypothetical protein HBH54_152450 [Parastagonospora nodorum]KAH3952272.1 hypothetical protein HBH53_055920 [Parastagonospora nodorum]KAH3983349.1 hypothetical protein HBH52_066800 [Parastagonospora nodorum]